MSRLLRRAPWPCALAVIVAGCAPTPVPDVVLVNARVFTNDAARPWAEAVAIKGERIVGVGASAEVRGTGGPATRVIDAGGRVVVPGFNDARVDLPLEAPTPASLAALDRDAVARGVTSLQVIASGPMRTLVAAAQQARRQARWRLIRSPADTTMLSTSDPTATVTEDEEPYLPPQPGVRLVANGVAWTVGTYRDGERRAIEPSRIDTVVGWAYGAEDPIVMAGASRDWLRAVARVGLAEVWRRKRPRFDVLHPFDGDRVPDLVRLGMTAMWSATAVRPTGPGLSMSPLMPGVFIDAGVSLALGSAGPTDPMATLSVATAPSRLAAGRPLSREEAVRAMTWGSAYAERAERDKGWLGPGTLADLAVLSDDVFTVAAERLPAVTSVLTLVGGAIVYDPGILPK